MTVLELPEHLRRVGKVKTYDDYRYFLITLTVKCASVDDCWNSPEYRTNRKFYTYAELKGYLNNYSRDLWVRIYTMEGWSYMVNSNSCYWLNWAAE